MKKLFVVLGALLLSAGLCSAADVVEGCWISIDEKTGKTTAGWEIYTENNVLYGRILSIDGFPQEEIASACKASYAGFPLSGDVSKMRVIGPPWIFSLKMDKPGQWSGGSIIDPNDGKMYKCKITFRPADGKKYKVDTLEMRGEIGLGIGKSQYWTKASKEEASALR
jgi:uncharacterized protein (DUF2147 family)